MARQWVILGQRNEPLHMPSENRNGRIVNARVPPTGTAERRAALDMVEDHAAPAARSAMALSSFDRTVFAEPWSPNIAMRARVHRHDYPKRRAGFASAPSASSAAVTEACPIERGPTRSAQQLSLQTSSADPGRGCPDQDSDPSLLTVLTVCSALVLTLIILVPARPSRENATSMP